MLILSFELKELIFILKRGLKGLLKVINVQKK